MTKRANKGGAKPRGGPKAGSAAREPMIDPRMVDEAIGPGAETMTVRERFDALWRRVLRAGGPDSRTQGQGAGDEDPRLI